MLILRTKETAKLQRFISFIDQFFCFTVIKAHTEKKKSKKHMQQTAISRVLKAHTHKKQPIKLQNPKLSMHACQLALHATSVANSGLTI